MAKAQTASVLAKALLPLGAALALAACGGNEEETAYEAGVTDVSGGELIVSEETPAVPVNVPDTPMTPVPDDATADGATIETVPAE